MRSRAAFHNFVKRQHNSPGITAAELAALLGTDRCLRLRAWRRPTRWRCPDITGRRRMTRGEKMMEGEKSFMNSSLCRHCWRMR
ncbi:hypothetical protein GDO81_004238 [Engystomops pustulosus]|uniref:Uncharacterized protein n=1 Tax=Engystomops pustulosus TaxID=76066 RepID=A0AAV6ZQV4_ENGPU|nr:hypothetical protein GDO81_004238 [Engystomops pustulosus]